MNIFQARFGTGQIITATDVSNSSLQTWLRREMIVGSAVDPIATPGKPGVRRSFSFHNVMEIAAAKALMDATIDVSTAFYAASLYAHTGDMDPGRPGRLPGCPFVGPVGTLLCVAGDRSVVTHWKPGNDVLANVMHSLGRPASFTVVYLNPIFDRVVTALGYEPADVMALATDTIKRGQAQAGWVG